MKSDAIDLRQKLKEHFRLDGFRNSQQEVVNSILSGNNTIVVMPTGGGKSLCYQLPAVLMQGTCIVISPLIALMKDQVDALTRLNISATFINSSLPADEISLRMNNAVRGEYKLLYIAPERITTRAFTEALQYLKVSFLAVDEAHCISEWGHDFRPSYLDIASIRNVKREIKTAAFTATATPDIIEDISGLLGMGNPQRFIRGFDRPNLSYFTEDTKSDKLPRLAEILKKSAKGAKIVYCGTRNKVELFEKGLKNAGIYAMAYHAGMAPEQRRKTQEKFIGSESPVIIATNAFGMGIDKPNVRAVIHTDLTQTLEAYYQEAGRAGRDGAAASCYMLHNESDIDLQNYFINTTYPGKAEILKIYNTIYDISSTPVGSKPAGPLYIDESRLAAVASVSINIVNSVLKFLEKQNIIRKTFPKGNANLMFTATKERMSAFFGEASQANKNILEALLRSVSSDAFNRQVEFRLENLLEKFSLNYKEFNNAVRLLEFLRILKYTPPNSGNSIIINTERLGGSAIPFDFGDLEKRKEIARRKLDTVARYTQTSLCKRNYILSYFEDDEYSGYCGKCSSCLSAGTVFAPKLKPGRRQKTILQALYHLGRGFGKKTLHHYFSGKQSEIVAGTGLEVTKYFGALDGSDPMKIETDFAQLIHNNYITLSSSLYPTLVLTEKGMALVDKREKQFDWKSIADENPGDFDEVLYSRLLALTKDIAAKHFTSPDSIAGQRAVRALATKKPVSAEELKKITGLGRQFIGKFGDTYLAAIKDYLGHKPAPPRENTKTAPWAADAARDIQSGMPVS